MRLLISALFALMFSGGVWGQDLINESRILKNPTNLFQYKKSVKSKTSDKREEVKSGSKFTIIGEENDFYKIYFWNWKKDSMKYYEYNIDKSTGEQKYFLIEKNLIDVTSNKIYNRVAPAWGTFTYPFKWRLSDGIMEPTFALAIAGGIKWNPWYKNEHVFSALVGVGPSTVILDKYNTSLEKPLDEKITASSISFSLNLMYQYDFVQFGVSGGIDRIFDNHLYNWNNQGKLWISLGVGISIFKNNERTATPTNN